MIRYWQLFLDSDFLYRFRRDRVASASFLVLLVMVVMSFSAPLIAPYDPYDPAQIDIMDSELPPAWQAEGDSRFSLGTDAQGRDMLSTMLYGTRISLTIGFFAVLLQMVLGIALGLVAGYFGGRIDSFLMRIADIQLSFSTLMLAIVVLAVFQASFGTELYNDLAIFMLVLVIGFAEWPQYARTVRASVLAEKKKEYVDAVRVIGLGPQRIIELAVVGGLLVLAQDGHGARRQHHRLDPPRLGLEHDGLGDAVIGQGSLDVLGEDVEAVGQDDHVLQPPREPQVAVRGELAGVAHAIPAVFGA